MKTLLLLVCLSACGSTEDISHQAEHYFDICSETATADIAGGTCNNVIHLTCPDGTDDYIVEPALGSNWLGTTCFINGSQTYSYACGVNEKGQAWVYCNYGGMDGGIEQ